MQNAADHGAVIHSFLAEHISRQIRLNLQPLVVVQPKEVASHRAAPNQSKQANQQPIHPAMLLLSSDPSSIAMVASEAVPTPASTWPAAHTHPFSGSSWASSGTPPVKSP